MKLDYLFKNLTEEMALRSEVVHHTSLEALAGILESGMLRPNIYPVSSRSGIIGGDRKDYELATLRRSVDRNISSIKKLKKFKGRGSEGEETYREKLGDLTENSGDIKIYLFNRTITSKLRGVSKKPISEYGKENEILVNGAIFKLYRVMKTYKDVEKRKVEKFLNDYRKDIAEIYNARIRPWDRAERIENSRKQYFEELVSVFDFKGEEDKIKESYENLSREITNAERSFKKGTREGEERIIFKDKKTGGVPVSPEYMKIRIITKFTVKDFIKMRDLIGLDFSVRGLRKNLIKYKKAFLVDENYTSLLDAINKFMKEEEWEY